MNLESSHQRSRCELKSSICCLSLWEGPPATCGWSWVSPSLCLVSFHHSAGQSSFEVRHTNHINKSIRNLAVPYGRSVACTWITKYNVEIRTTVLILWGSWRNADITLDLVYLLACGLSRQAFCFSLVFCFGPAFCFSPAFCFGPAFRKKCIWYCFDECQKWERLTKLSSSSYSPSPPGQQ